MHNEARRDELNDSQGVLHFETETEVTVPECTIFNLPEKTFVRIEQIDSVNFFPAKVGRRREPRMRQVGLLLPVNQMSGMVAVVQPEKAGSNEWSLIQGGIKPNETARDAVQREAYEEAGIFQFRVLQYVGSYKAPVDGTRSEKRRRYDYQLFHCFIASMDDVSVQTHCPQVAHVSLFHQDTVLQTLLETASPTKQQLLPKICQAAVEYGLLPPSACRRS